jgi:polysaccharide biosynthesis/export protein
MDRRRFLLTSLAGGLAVLAPPVLAQDAYVYVQGEVRKPGAIPHTSGMTFSQAIALAGGFTATASPRETYLIRGQETRRFNLNSHPVYPVIDPEVRPGDIIQVRQRFF